MKYYKRVNTEGETTTVESYSHEKAVAGAIAISKTEFDSYIASLPVIEPIPIRDYGQEIDEIKKDLKALKDLSK